MASIERQTSWEVRENFRKFSGQVLHVVRDNEIFRYRVDDSGRILHEHLEKARGAAQRGWRKVVTGDPEKKIRDYITEVPQVKLIDKLSFTFGVASIVLAEFLALRHPTYFTQFYYILMSFLVTNRYLQYKEEKSELFMFDFCYFMNVSVALQTGLFPNCLMWYKANYVLCMGCLMLAIVVWQNSLVFHSIDKLTSFFLHAFPPLTLHLYRWQLIPSEIIKHDDYLSTWDVMFWPLVLYSTWQLAYCLIIDILMAEKLRNNPQLVTSVRYLVQDKKNGMNRLVTKVARRMAILGPKEEFVVDSPLSKIMFMISQLLYTLVTLVLTPFLYSNYTLSFVYIASIYMWCIWRGGTYYIEVFSERYKLKFQQTEVAAERRVGEEFEEDLEDPDLVNQIYAAFKETSRNSENSQETSSEGLVGTQTCVSRQETHVSRQETHLVRRETRSVAGRQEQLTSL